MLTRVADVRSACLRAREGAMLPERLNGLLDALGAWCRLPRAGRSFYAGAVAGALFEIVADLEDDPSVAACERTTIELSLWDAAAMVELLRPGDARALYVKKRRARLRRAVFEAASTDAERLVLRWADLLRPRSAPCRGLPGPLQEDAQAIVDLMASLGLPRRAKVVAGKFHVPCGPLTCWAIENGPLSEELDRTRRLIGRVLSPSRPTALEAIRYAWHLGQVLAASLDAVPLAVGNGGVITIDDEAFGVIPV